MILIILCAVFLLRNLIVKTVLVHGVSALSGMKVSLDKFDLDFLQTKVLVKDLTIRNPEGFDEKVFCALPRLEIDFNAFASLRTHVLTFDLIAFELDHFVIDRNKAGVVNLNLLPFMKKTKEEKSPAPAPQPAKKRKGGPPKIYIKKFILTMRQVGYIDEGRLAAKKQVVDMRIDHEVFEDIHNIDALVSIILLKLMQNQTIGRLPLNIDVAATQAQLEAFTKEQVAQAKAVAQGAVKGVENVLDTTTGELAKTSKKILEPVKTVAPDTGKVEEAVKESAGKLKQGLFNLTNTAVQLVPGVSDESQKK